MGKRNWPTVSLSTEESDPVGERSMQHSYLGNSVRSASTQHSSLKHGNLERSFGGASQPSSPMEGGGGWGGGRMGGK